jgi:hypothetical protein
MPPRKRRGGGRRTVSPTPTTWIDDAYALWRSGWSTAEISALLDERHGILMAPNDVEHLVHEHVVRKLAQTWSAGR